MIEKIIPSTMTDLKGHLCRLETDQLIIVTDYTIDFLYPQLIEELKEIPQKSVFYWKGSVGEQNKSLKQYEKCTHDLLAHGLHRQAHLVAIGGGGLCDFAGFVAATLLRGIPWSLVPTTLLSQADAAIGGKTALNTSFGKNLIGRFHFPQNIFLCQDFLKTLEPSDRLSGLGEVVKCAFLSRPLYDGIIEGKGLEWILPQCALLKQKIVAKDPYEQNERKFLNFGHSFGHAYELLTKSPHGLSVLWGIETINRHFLDHHLTEPYQKLLDALEITPQFFTIQEKDIFSFLFQDKKKVSQDKMQLVLLEEIGRPYLKTFSFQEIRDVLSAPLS